MQHTCTLNRNQTVFKWFSYAAFCNCILLSVHFLNNGKIKLICSIFYPSNLLCSSTYFQITFYNGSLAFVCQLYVFLFIINKTNHYIKVLVHCKYIVTLIIQVVIFFISLILWLKHFLALYK